MLRNINAESFIEFLNGEYSEYNDEIRKTISETEDEIIEKKQATFYGIAMSVRRICEAIVRDEKSVLPVSSIQHGAAGIERVALSIPAVVGKDGIETVVPIKLSDQEASDLKKSAEQRSPRQALLILRKRPKVQTMTGGTYS